MKGLKVATIVSLTVLCLAFVFLWYFFMTATVSVVTVSSSTQQAAQNPELFSHLQNSIDDDTFVGTVFQKPLVWGAVQEYVTHSYEVTIANGCLVPIDMVEVQIVPHSMDVVQQSSLSNVLSIPAKSSAVVEATILTKESTNVSRELIVTYYVWGQSFQFRTTYVKNLN